MKNSKMIFSVLMLVGVICAGVGLALNAWDYLIAGNVSAGYGFFESWDGLNALAVGANGTWATITMIAFLVAFAALVACLICVLMNTLGVLKGVNGIVKILAVVGIIAIIAMLAFAIVFVVLTDATTTIGNTTIVNGFRFGIGFWLAFAGSLFAALMAFLAAKK